MKYGKYTLRHELKYFINYHEYQYLKKRLNAALELDRNAARHGSYHIRSLYFDDMYMSAFREKESGVFQRKKYRIRIYQLSDSVIKFEKKLKFGQYISKISKGITRDEFYRLLNEETDFLLKNGDPFLREVYIEMNINLLRPAVIVDYDREAYIFEAGNVRITFDQDLRAGVDSFDIFDPQVITKTVFDSPIMIMEVKYDSFLPAHIHDLIQISRHNISAASKYVLCVNTRNDINCMPLGGIL